MKIDSLIRYSHEAPALNGVYACRVVSLYAGSIQEDKFLRWDGEKWGHVQYTSDYTGEVLGWIGPLERWA